MSRRCPLEGSWSVERRVRDLRDGNDATFAGVATIAAAPGEAGGAGGTLRWHEEGELASRHHRGRATRDLRIVPAGDAWSVLFDDGRPFHHLDLRTGSCEAVHLCGPDRYEGTFRLSPDGDLRIWWRVAGPAKDLEIVGAYTPRA